MKVGVISLGCDKNRCNTETMLAYLTKGGFEITNDEQDSDIIIINTCAFIESARKESIDTIFDIAQYKQKGKLQKLIVTGCLPQKYIDEIYDEIPEVDAFLGVRDYPSIVDVINQCNNCRVNAVNTCKEMPSNDRYLTTPFNYAYLLIADGCNNHCTYCTIPQIRGKYTSRPLNDIINEAIELIDENVKELILVAQDVTNYGSDLNSDIDIVNLIQEISKISQLERIRLMYCYPEKVTDRLIDEIKNNNKVVKYIDVPLQHASTNVLKRMGRKGTYDSYLDLFNKLTEKIPKIAIRSTVMVGFPGESEEDFNILCNFVKQVKPINCGVFIYSDEEDAASFKLSNKISTDVKEKRYNALINLLSEISKKEKEKFIGKDLEVVYEDIDFENGMFVGRSYISCPDIDSVVYFTSDKPMEFGTNVLVRITNVINDDLIGECR